MLALDAEGIRVATSAEHKVQHRTINTDGLKTFYREAGSKDAPAIPLLHGFPTSSHKFRHLIPVLAGRYHGVAPDFQGFGHSDVPNPAHFPYSFESYARIMDKFTQMIGLHHYALYLQDYGAPIGLRLALLGRERVTALIVQNGNAYEEGLSGEWEPIKTYWREPMQANRERLHAWLNPPGDTTAVRRWHAGSADYDVQPRHLDARLGTFELSRQY